MAYFTFNFTRGTLIEETKYRLEAIADIHITRINRIIDGYNTRLNLFVNKIDVNTINISGEKVQISNSLKDILQVYNDIESISLVNAQGKIVASTDDVLVGKKQIISNFPPTKINKESSLVDIVQKNKEISQTRFRKPIFINDQWVGELEIITKRNAFALISSDYSGLGSTGEIILAKQNDKNETFFITPRRFDKTVGYDSTQFLSSSPTAESLKKNESFFTDRKDDHGKPVFAVTRYIADVRWGLAVDIEEEEALQSINTLRDIVFISSFIFSILIVLVTLFFVYSITGPIVHIASVARQISTGDYSKRALVLAKDEIGELAKGFNTMLDSLQEIHKNLEKKVHERTRELEASNKDLEAFSYSVSHDLRAPLRAIDGFSQILEEDYKKNFDDEGKRVVATIRRSTKQMGNLIDDLLAFSRLGRRAIKIETIDMTDLAKSSFDEIKQSHPKQKIDFKMTDLSLVPGDPSLLRQVWINLLSNAVKFTAKKEIAKITVGSKIKNNDIVFFVKDNGAGFNMKYANKLFGVFQRLHGPQEFEGTGVGLAIVSRIITKHEGKVWAKGKIGQGATFYFSLPKHSTILKQKDYYQNNI